MKSARRRAREFALQALYAWQISGCSAADALVQVKTLEGYERCDRRLLENIVQGVTDNAPVLRAHLVPCLIRRDFDALSPVERAILYIGTHELSSHPETPFKVVLNEAIDLGRSFGGTDGHRFVNGVLERVAEALRPGEVARTRLIA